MKKIACITGASSGIGRATAQSLAKEGYQLILCGRRKERLEELQASLAVNSILLTFDVSDQPSVIQAFESLPSDWKNIDVLVNNAGNAHGMSAIQEGDVADWDAMMASNVTGLLYVSKEVLIPVPLRIMKLSNIKKTLSLDGWQPILNLCCSRQKGDNSRYLIVEYN